MNFPENNHKFPSFSITAPADSAWRPQRWIFKDGLTIHQVLHCNGNPHLGPSGRAVGIGAPSSSVCRCFGATQGTHQSFPGLPGLFGFPGSPGESKGLRPWRCPRPQRFPRLIRHSIASQSPAGPESCTKGEKRPRQWQNVVAILQKIMRHAPHVFTSQIGISPIPLLPELALEFVFAINFVKASQQKRAYNIVWTKLLTKNRIV